MAMGLIFAGLFGIIRVYSTTSRSPDRKARRYLFYEFSEACLNFLKISGGKFTHTVIEAGNTHHSYLG